MPKVGKNNDQNQKGSDINVNKKWKDDLANITPFFSTGDDLNHLPQNILKY